MLYNIDKKCCRWNPEVKNNSSKHQQSFDKCTTVHLKEEKEECLISASCSATLTIPWIRCGYRVLYDRIQDVLWGYTSLANQWMSETQKRNRPTGEKVCTDLFLLNSSRFNQQIIDLIKWHPLLGQEPARSMQISQAKKKKNTSMHTHSTSPTNQTQHFNVCFSIPWNTEVDATLTPQPPEANTGRDRRTGPRSWASA